jgi:hypothetical protein
MDIPIDLEVCITYTYAYRYIPKKRTVHFDPGYTEGNLFYVYVYIF